MLIKPKCCSFRISECWVYTSCIHPMAHQFLLLNKSFFCNKDWCSSGCIHGSMFGLNIHWYWRTKIEIWEASRWCFDSNRIIFTKGESSEQNLGWSTYWSSIDNRRFLIIEELKLDYLFMEEDIMYFAAYEVKEEGFVSIDIFVFCILIFFLFSFAEVHDDSE